ncbi:adenosylmethionine--8-amino-7-oxononanoate transaminase [Candidatus Profftella armatura]|uniref:adenosylmethionine--8-amino-7-oxononanoate transaminase n=1 Tax=Candidatus Profftella armatura TaxID=669502 RepID=UPI003D987B6E
MNNIVYFKKKSSNNLVIRSLKNVWHPCAQIKYPAEHKSNFYKIPLSPISLGNGPWLIDVSGKRYLDAISSWWVNLFGHSNSYINKALKNQLNKLEHVMLSNLTHKPVIKLSEKLSSLTQYKLGHCFYGSDGASAVEVALKMSFHYWYNKGFLNKKKFICLQNSYHGETLGALAVTNIQSFKEIYTSLLNKTYIITTPDSRNINKGNSANEIARCAIFDLEILIKKNHNKIAAIIIEPLVQCAGGMIMYDSIYLKLVREICNNYNIHLIADEIAVGCGRTGKFFACEHAEIWPDFLCLSKGITGGYLPLSLVMTTDKIYNSIYYKNNINIFLHSHSYSGNPLACCAALATLEIFNKDNILQRISQDMKKITKALTSLITHPKIINFRQKGMIWAFDVIIEDPEQIETFSKKFFVAALKNELLLRPIGNTVYLMPPYILNKNEIQHMTSAIFQTFNEVIT